MKEHEIDYNIEAGKQREKRQRTQQKQKHAQQYLPNKINKSSLKQQINHRKF